MLSRLTRQDIQGKLARPIRRWAAWSYFVCIALFLLCIILQLFFIGAGVLVAASPWIIVHMAVGSNLLLLALLLLPLSFLARLPTSLKWLTLLLFVLIILQPVLILARRSPMPLLSALHAVNALPLFLLPALINRWVWRLLHSQES